MIQATLNFPRKFLWGTASASHPFEGNNNNNNWYAWEKSGRVDDRQTSGLACDWWGGRWREDFDRAYESGQNAHRLSVEWSRIQPDQNRWDEEALDYYRQMVRGLLDRGMLPMITLHHFTEPLWVSELGSWQNPSILEYFSMYVNKTVEALREYVSLWCTFNEPNVLAMKGYLTGKFPPGKIGVGSLYKVFQNMIKGHVVAYQIIHDLQQEAQVGLSNHYCRFQPASKFSPFDRLALIAIDSIFNNAIPNTLASGTMRFFGVRKKMPGVNGTQDYFGLNYETSKNIALNLRKYSELFIDQSFSGDVNLSPAGSIANDPDGFFQSLRWAKGFKLPIIITGNGTEDPNDDFRLRYIVQHVRKLWLAVNFNWKIKGYFHWSLVDNFHWENGWLQRYGLWDLDPSSQERRKRPSADLFAAICKENTLSSEMVSQYTPDIFDQVFPS